MKKLEKTDIIFILFELLFGLACSFRVYFSSEAKFPVPVIIAGIAVFNLVLMAILFFSSPEKKKKLYYYLSVVSVFFYPALYAGKNIRTILVTALVIVAAVPLYRLNEKKLTKDHPYLPSLVILGLFMFLLFFMYAPHMLQEETLLEY